MKYSWLSAHQHVLQRPDTYVGPVASTIVHGHAFDTKEETLSTREVQCEASPALFKLFDEVIVNAMDNSQRDPSQKYIKTSVDAATGVFRVCNDGGTIPIKHWKDTERYIPEILMYELMSGENFADDRAHVGGRNGLGVKIVNILSTKFQVEILNVEDGFSYSQTFTQNATQRGTPIVKKLAKHVKRSSTTIQWVPDFERLGMSLPLDANVMSLFETRAFDAAACTNINVFFNEQKIPIKTFKEYTLGFGGTWVAKELLKTEQCELEVCVAKASHGSTIGFVNGLQCSQGTHIDLVHRKLHECVNEYCKKKLKKACTVRPQQVKDAFDVVVTLRVNNPSFSSQTKERLDLRVDKFGAQFALSPSFVRQLEKVCDVFVDLLKAQEDKDVAKSVQQTKKQRHLIPKYQRALKPQANLYITEGDSAMAMAIAGFGVIGRERNGVFPLRGKLVNVFGMSHKSALSHKEIMHLSQILQLEPSKMYDASSTKNLPYRHVVIFTDQDHDGSHIMGLVLTFLRELYPSLFKVWPDFVKRFATPLVKAKVGKELKCFYSEVEFKKWKETNTPVSVKYYKGLGTSTDTEAKEYFRNIQRHLTIVQHTGDASEKAISTFFAASQADMRKTLLKQIDPNSCIDYEKDVTTFENFCHDELIHHCAADNERSIPSAIDGFKPSHRKILFTARKRIKKEMRVAALAAMTTEETAYHHGEASLVMAIMMMAQQHVGTNNISYLVPKGQFGSRCDKRDTGLAAPRYVYTEPSAASRLVFKAEDDGILSFLEDDGISIEPEYYIPVIANALINGSEGIGTGYKTSIPPFNPKEVIQATREFIEKGQVQTQLLPFYQGFKGTIELVEGGFLCTGLYTFDKNTLTITELPPKVWSNPYFEWLQHRDLSFVNDVQQHSTKDSVCIKVVCKPNTSLSHEKILEEFKMTTKITTTHMFLYDAQHVLQQYKDPEDVIKEHAAVRRNKYRARLDKQIEELEMELVLIENKHRFVQEVVSDAIDLRQMTKDELKSYFTTHNFFEHNEFKYLLDMKIYAITKDEVKRLVDLLTQKNGDLDILKKTTVDSLWLKELNEFEAFYQSNKVFN